MISSAATHAWERWIAVTRSRCHLHFEIDEGHLDSHVAACRTVSWHTALRVSDDLRERPSSILEMGCSVGFNCLALAERFPLAHVVGIEPDGEACLVAATMAADSGLGNVQLVQGVVELLTFPDASIDWFICNTDIEDANDVYT